MNHKIYKQYKSGENAHLMLINLEALIVKITTCLVLIQSVVLVLSMASQLLNVLFPVKDILPYTHMYLET